MMNSDRFFGYRPSNLFIEQLVYLTVHYMNITKIRKRIKNEMKRLSMGLLRHPLDASRGMHLPQ